MEKLRIASRKSGRLSGKLLELSNGCSISLTGGSGKLMSYLSDFTIHDEAYGDKKILNVMHPLLVNNHPKASRYAAWTNPFGKSRIVCIALGHDKRAYENTNFQKPLENVIL